jgi:hypothetical protein
MARKRSVSRIFWRSSGMMKIAVNCFGRIVSRNVPNRTNARFMAV